MRKHLFSGLIGALLMLAAIVVVLPQYGDYVARAQSERWLEQLEATKEIIGGKAISSGTLSASGGEVPLPVFKGKHRPSFVEVRPDGVIFLQGGKDGQFLALIPALHDGIISWRCLGGPSVAVRPSCRAGS